MSNELPEHCLPSFDASDADRARHYKILEAFVAARQGTQCSKCDMPLLFSVRKHGTGLCDCCAHAELAKRMGVGPNRKATDRALAMATNGIISIRRTPGTADGQHIVACVNACRGLNPEHVPELVKFAKAVSLLIDAPLWAEAAKELLAKVKA